MAKGKSAVLTVKILTDASSVPKGLATAAATYGKFAQALGSKSVTAGTKVGDALVSGIDKAIMFGLKGLGIAAGAILGVALFKGFERLNAIDQAQAKLRGLGMSAKTVKKIMDNALASVQQTAFGLDEAAGVAGQLVAAGIQPGKQLEATLKLVADSATIAGTSMTDMGAIWGKVAASNKLQGDVVQQLQERQIPILALIAKQYHITQQAAAQMVSKGKVDFATFAAAMKDGMGGAALESGNTFMGAWKNTLASLSRIGANLLGPLFAGAKDGLKGIPALLAPVEKFAVQVGEQLAVMAGWLQKNTGLLKILGVIAGTVVGILLTFRAVVAVMQAYRAVMLVVKAAQLGYTAATYGAAAATYAGAGATLAQNIALVAGKAAFLAVSGATKVAAAAQWLWNAALSANPIGIIILAIAALVAGLIWFFTQTKLGQQIWAGFVSFMQQAWASIKAAIAAVIDWFKPAWDVVSALFKLAVLAFLITMRVVWNGIKAVIGPVIDWFRSTWTKVASFFSLVVLGWKIIFAQVFAGIRAIVAPVAAWFQSVWSAAVNVVRGIVRALQPIFTAVFGGIRSFLAPVISWFKSAWESAVNAVKSVINALKGPVMAVFNAILAPIRAVENAIRGVVGWVQNLINWISKIPFSDLGKVASKVTKSSASAPAASAPAAYSSPAVRSRIMAGAHIAPAPRVGVAARSASSTAGAGGGIVININGGLDSSDAIARRVEQVVGGRVRRTRGASQPLRAS